MLIVALDLSIRCTGCVAVPSSFATLLAQHPNAWRAVANRVVESQEMPNQAPVRERTARLVVIARTVARWVQAQNPDLIAFEEQAFNQAQAHAREIGELTGIVKARLLPLNLPMVAVPASAARKTLLGKVPAHGAKKVVAEVLRGMGAPWKGTDRGDAFVIANHVLSIHGHPAVTIREAA